MNYRNVALTRLAYELDCQLQIPEVCTGGVGEPCHANWQLWGKNGGGEKAPDWAIASGCRACHNAIDQGSKLSEELREHYWMRGHVRTMNALWAAGSLRVAPKIGVWANSEAKPLSDERSTLEVSTTTQKKRREGLPEKEGVFTSSSHSLPPSRRRGSKRGTHCVRPDKVLPRGNRIV